jgi:hypothetical protein
VFSLDSLKKYNGPLNGHGEHIFWSNIYGPMFGFDGSLGFNSPMNKANAGHCYIN